MPSNEYMREYMLLRYHERMTYARKSLGGACVECGSNQNLDLDHIDPETKSFTIGGSLWSTSWSKFLNELVKCQLLCRQCHVDKTLREVGQSRASHGTLTMAVHYKCKCQECLSVRRAASKRYKEAAKRRAADARVA